MKNSIKKISKSVQFLDGVVVQLDKLAKDLNLVQVRGGAITGNISSIIAELIDFGLAHRNQFVEWRSKRFSGK